MGERIVRPLAGGDLAVELEQAAVRLAGVVRDRPRPAVSLGDGFVELPVQVGKIGVRAVVDLVVELREADLAVEADISWRRSRIRMPRAAISSR
ncbi:MAG: hypothetical protein ACYC1P_07775 [Gaiellaceae bacterium]